MIIELSEDAKAARAKVLADFEARRETSSTSLGPKPEPQPAEPRKTREEAETELAADRAYLFAQRVRRLEEDQAAHLAAVEQEHQRRAAAAPDRSRLRQELDEREEAARQARKDAKLQRVRDLARVIATLSQADRDQLGAELVAGGSAAGPLS